MRRLPAIVASALVLAGCALPAPSPPRPRPPTTARTPLAIAAASHEYPSPAAHETAPGAPTPVAAITAFATAYINWSADTVTARMLALARSSVGQARSAMELAAGQSASDYELQRGGIANRGVVESVAPARAAGAGRWIVVTEERTTATATATNVYRGLRPAWHVTLVTVTSPRPGRWVISGWQPEN